MLYLDSEVASLYRSLSCKNFSTFGFVASKMSRHSSCSNACNTSPKVPPSCMYISSIALVRPSFGRTQVSTHCREGKKKYVEDEKNFFVELIFYSFHTIFMYLCSECINLKNMCNILPLWQKGCISLINIYSETEIVK